MSSPLTVSFEFFPPADDAAAAQLWQAVERLAPLQPRYVSVTYGADGSTRTRTHDCVLRILRETALTVVPHLTCVAATRSEVCMIAMDYWRAGIRHLVALRGDPPPQSLGPEGAYLPLPGGYAYAADLVRGLRELAPFEISVAAYPEGHPESGSVGADLLNLRRKVDAGATTAITQFFFDHEAYLRYRDAAAAVGIAIPIVPGILPIVKFSQLTRFAARCGTRLPEWLRRRFAGIEDDGAACRAVALEVACLQVERLRRDGVDAFHFYTLNRAELTRAICASMGVGVQDGFINTPTKGNRPVESSRMA
jgi:methylenetetrahydrofolate reductase (NADPH)